MVTLETVLNYIKQSKSYEELETIQEAIEKRTVYIDGHDWVLDDNPPIGIRIYYTIGHGEGETKSKFEIGLENPYNEDFQNALDVVDYILSVHTGSVPGYHGCWLDASHFEEYRPKEIYDILYNQSEAPEIFKSIKLTPQVLKFIREIVSSSFWSHTSSMTFLSYSYHELIFKK